MAVPLERLQHLESEASKYSADLAALQMAHARLTEDFGQEVNALIARSEQAQTDFGAYKKSSEQLLRARRASETAGWTIAGILGAVLLGTATYFAVTAAR